MNNWKYKGEDVNSIQDMPEGAIGFIYEINSPEGKYLGKKLLVSTRTKKMTKSQIEQMVDKRKSKKIVTKTESNWKSYFSSLKDSDLPKRWKSGEVECTRTILAYCFSKMDTTYLECKYLFQNGVLESDEYLNANILGKFYNRTMTQKSSEYAT